MKNYYTLLNIIDQDNKYLIVTSTNPIVNLKFELDDLKSRAKNFFYKILKNLMMIDLCFNIKKFIRSSNF